MGKTTSADEFLITLLCSLNLAQEKSAVALGVLFRKEDFYGTTPNRITLVFILITPMI